MNASLEDQRAVVFGGSSGIGFAAAQALLELGAQVTIVGRNLQRLDEAGSALGAVSVASLDCRDLVTIENDGLIGPYAVDGVDDGDVSNRYSRWRRLTGHQKACDCREWN